MADTPQQERTEQPTPKRLKEAREKGQVARSRELTTAIVMMAGASTCLIAGGSMLESLSNMLRTRLSSAGISGGDAQFMTEALGGGIASGLTAIAPLMMVVLVAAILAPSLTGGWSFSMKAVAPKLEKLSPAKGLKRIFSSRGLIELVKAFAKALLVTGVAALLLHSMSADLLTLGSGPLGPSLSSAAHMIGRCLMILSASLLLIAAIDVPFQLWNHKQQLMMTRQEVRDELKETDGRPEIKSRIRALQQERSRQRMMQDVPTADVVITNPTHFAVALKYDEAGNGAPVVVAKGADLVAARIREIAEEHRVPLFEAPPLARVLFHNIEISEEIPPRLYSAVAQVLTWIYQIKDAHLNGTTPVRPVIKIDEDEFK